MLEPLRNTRPGRRIFMLGNGASLLGQMELLKELHGLASFTCNHFHEWEDAPFRPMYHGTTDIPDRYTLRECEGRTAWHICATRIPAIAYYPWLVVPMSPDIGANRIMAAGFAGLAPSLPPLPTGQTTPLTLAQVAAWIGYREFYFLGIEHKGGWCYGPDVDRSMHPRILSRIKQNFARAKADVEAAGGTMVDCTPNGEMNEVLGYVELEEVLSGILV